MSKDKNNVNGWLVINKPVGVNSTRVVAIVKRFYNAKKVGHAGTLDPLANGVLPIALGEATKTINFCMDSDKEYQFTVKWGEETSTCDKEGEVIATSDKIPTLAEIKAILSAFIGEIDQVPPVYSAIKIDGKRAYDLARSGQEVEMKARKIVIYELELIESSVLLGNGGVPIPHVRVQENKCSEHEDTEGVNTPSGLATNPYSTFRVRCGKGTYVRSLARDIAEKLGTKGHVTELIRTKVGKFCINNAILLENFENTVYKPESFGLLLPVEQVLDDIPVLTFNPTDAKAIRQGKQVAVLGSGFNDGQIAAIKAENALLAIGEFCDGFIKPVRVFNI
jgi:tRNA pseudouridine55 synthase